MMAQLTQSNRLYQFITVYCPPGGGQRLVPLFSLTDTLHSSILLNLLPQPLPFHFFLNIAFYSRLYYKALSLWAKSITDFAAHVRHFNASSI